MSSPDVLIAIPLKPFGVAKQRLSPILDARQRRKLGKAVAAHVIATALDTGRPVAVVTGDTGVAGWARRLGATTITEPSGGGLNGAAAAAIAEARRKDLAWMILHADLPALGADDLAAVLDANPARRVVITPSHNGGTSLIAAGLDTFPFSYGPASFRRHLAAAGRHDHLVLVRTGLAIDLDGPDDLEVAARLPAGRWLEPVLPEGFLGPAEARAFRSNRPLA